MKESRVIKSFAGYVGRTHNDSAGRFSVMTAQRVPIHSVGSEMTLCSQWALMPLGRLGWGGGGTTPSQPPYGAQAGRGHAPSRRRVQRRERTDHAPLTSAVHGVWRRGRAVTATQLHHRPELTLPGSRSGETGPAPSHETRSE